MNILKVMTAMKCKGVVDPTRSHIMRSVRSKGTGPELRLRKALFAKGYRYFVNYKGLPGKPDIVFLRLRIAIFVNGCFWHRHGCSKSTMPKTRVAFWQDKFNRNVDRDKREYAALTAMGWHPLIVWECEIKNDFDGVLNLVLAEIQRRRSTNGSKNNIL